MHYPEHVILDVDEVLLAYTPSFVPFFCGRNNLPLPVPGAQWEFNMAKWLGADPDLVAAEIVEFNSGRHPEFGQLRPLPGAVAGVQYLLERGCKLHALTSAASEPMGRVLRHHNLELFGRNAFESITILPLGACKRDALAQIPPALFIDDLEHNLRAGAEAGHIGLLMAADHNRTLQDDFRASGGIVVESWRHLVHDLERDAIQAPACPQPISP